MIDSISARVIQGRLDQIASEMSANLIRMAFSTIIKEMEDIGCAMVSHDGGHLSEAENTPLQLGQAAYIVEGILRLVQERGETIKDGDLYIHNDPFSGSSHSPDVAFALPIFYQGELVAWACNAAHHMDIGGAMAGSMIHTAQDVWADGLRFRALRIRENGIDNAQLWRMIGDNVRLSEYVTADMRAQVSALELAAKRLVTLLDDVGVEQLRAAQAWQEDYAERMIRQQIAALPDGEYRAEGVADGDLNSDNPAHKRIPIVATVRVKGDSIEVDLTGTAPQLEGGCAMNMPFEGTTCVVIMAVLRAALLDSENFDGVPQNRGLMRAIDIAAPEGTFVNPSFPAATNLRHVPAFVLADTVLKALAQVAPERCCAGISHLQMAIVGGLKDGKQWSSFEFHEAAYGARADKDGVDTVDVIISNTRSSPAEEVDTSVPVRTVKWELNTANLGHGKFRGGLSTVKTLEFLENDTWGNINMEGVSAKPWGLQGGGQGSEPKILHHTGEGGQDVRELPNINPYRMINAGERIELVGMNAAGYGSPLEREPQKVLDDYLDELISLEDVSEIYGVVLKEDNVGGLIRRAEIDVEATGRLRKQRKSA